MRTHTLHDPVAYKNRELGQFVLQDRLVLLFPGFFGMLLILIDTRPYLVHLKVARELL